MGVWAKLGGIALGITGAVTGNPALISAGASVIGADIGAEGAKKAANQQIAAADAAKAEANARYDATRAEQRAIYDQSSSAFQPFIGLGQGALPNLAGMTGITMPALSAPSTPQTLQELGTPAPQAQTAMPRTEAPADERARNRTMTSYENKRGLTLGELGGQGLVMVVSPDGSERRLLPRAQADIAIKAGGREM
jgi:hypothetical protein